MQETQEDIKAVLNSSLLANAKLAKAVEILMQYHLTLGEKNSIAKRIDACKTFEDLDITMTLVGKELQRSYIDENTQEKWSPQFVDDIKGYYESGFPFNPLNKISEVFKTVKDFIVLQELVLNTKDEEKRETMKKELDNKRTDCASAVQEINNLLSEMGA